MSAVHVAAQPLQPPLSGCFQHGPQSQDFVMGHCPEPEQQEAVGLSISDMDTALQRAKGSRGREAIRGPHMGTRSREKLE